MTQFGEQPGRANHHRRDSSQRVTSPREAPSVVEVLRIKKHARSLRPQAREAAQRLAHTGNRSTHDMWSGSTLYEEVVYRVAADNNWRTSVKSIANQVVHEVARLYPNRDGQESRFAAYLTECAAEALVFTLPSSGQQAAIQLRMEVQNLRPHDDQWCSVMGTSIMFGQNDVCPACGSVAYP